MPDFVIKLGIDRSESKPAAAAASADMKGVEAATVKAARAMSAALDKTTDHAAKQAAEIARIEEKWLLREYRDRVAYEAKKQRAIEKTTAATAAAYGELGQKGTGAFRSIGVQMAVAQSGMQMLTRLASALGDGMQRAADNARNLARGFSDQRDDLRELAAIQERQADSAFALEFAKTGRLTGLKPGENLRFQTNFYNSGAQFIGPGKNISTEEGRQLVDQLGALAVAKGLEPGVVGDAGGSMLGFKDFQRAFGGRASEEVAGETFRGIQILQRGRSDTAQGLKAATELSAAMLNEDAMKGAFTKPSEVYALTSLMSEGFKGEESAHARALNRALNRFDDDAAGPLLEEAGITKTMPLFERLEKIAPVINRISRETNTPIPQVVSEYFPEEREKQSLSLAINKGVGPGGVLADRLKYGEQFGAESARRTVEEFRRSETGRQRAEDANAAMEAARHGAANAAAQVLRQRAETELKAEGKIDTTGSNVMDALTRNVTGGLLNPRQLDIEARARRNLGIPASPIDPLGFTPEGRDERLRREIEAQRAAGRDPLAPAGDGGMRSVSPFAAGDPHAKLLREQNRMMRAQAEAPLPNRPAPTYLR